MRLAVVGIGLMGGSIALSLKKKGFVSHVIGVDQNIEHQKQALQLGIVDEIMSLEDAVTSSDIIALATPVNVAELLLPTILNLVNKQVVFDLGSTKESIVNVANAHSNKGRFVPTHPMWGTEFSGPTAAQTDAFVDKATVICNKTQVDADALAIIEQMYAQLGMHILYMDAIKHDIHVAYISHISHITSFALANTVLEKEKESDAIFELASGGFESTVRLAKSNAEMWVPIFMQNKENVLDVLNEHISQLRKFKASLEKENPDYLLELIQNANKIKRILK
ncbi:MAG: prephenate dehydrogenase [Bacteroidetes bacterium]|jgi:prephenate dehydrogenase|nr:prephenate dehydrogenase [Bacteroidota bacterium]HBT93916.1 prephenate dehydrogenase [Chitinophagaceae bacterium]